jgi:hypothetical protein
MLYESEVRTDSDYDEIPVIARFDVSKLDLDEIRKLATIVEENSLFKVEKFDYRTDWFDSEDNPDSAIRTEADTLNVSATEFWFAAYIKHTNVEILTQRFKITDEIIFVAN